MEDFYAILGLDPGASQESIKFAYRRLAREHHPDRNIGSTESEKMAFSAQMAQLNGAYAVLSDAKLKHEYDENLKILSALNASKTVSQVTETVTKTRTRTVTKSASSQHSAPRQEVDSTLAVQLSKQLCANLRARHKSLSWEEKTLEGFDWGLEGSSWSSHYCVAGRGFGVLDKAAAKKFTNYSEVVIASGTRSIRKSHFLFLLAFQRFSDWDSIAAEFNRFFAPGTHTTFTNIPVIIALMDARQGRTMRFGSQLHEKRLDELLQCISSAS